MYIFNKITSITCLSPTDVHTTPSMKTHQAQSSHISDPQSGSKKNIIIFA